MSYFSGTLSPSVGQPAIEHPPSHVPDHHFTSTPNTLEDPGCDLLGDVIAIFLSHSPFNGVNPMCAILKKSLLVIGKAGPSSSGSKQVESVARLPRG